MLHDTNPVTGPIIRSIGIPAIVEAVVPISHIRLKGDALDIIGRRYLFSRGHQTAEHEWYDDESLIALAPSHIQRIIVFPSPEFYELTGCAEWREQLS
jgi:hypothetical protein